MDEKMIKILIVDDDEEVVNILKELIGDVLPTAIVLTAHDGDACIEQANAEDPDLILLDIVMPGMDGFEVCTKIKTDPKLSLIPVIFITGERAGMENRIFALECGAEAFLSKPFEISELIAQIRAMVKIKAANVQKQHENERLSIMVEEKTRELKENYILTLDILENLRNENEARKKVETVLRKSEEKLLQNYDKLNNTMNSFITAMVYTVEMRDPYTSGHQQRVGDLSVKIASEMGLSEFMLETVKMASSIHDLGKISIPSEILIKPGKLSKIEFDFIKVHSRAGYDILSNIDFPWPLAEIIYQHHEKLDGSGYPRGLTGKEIMFEAKILAVADAVEAMISHRPYRSALGIEFTMDEIRKYRGIYYDEAVVDACIVLFLNKGYSI